MASPLEDDVFQRLKQKVDPAETQRRHDQVNERVHAQAQKSHARQAELVSNNLTLPVTISSVRVLQAKHTRHGFLERVFSPLLIANSRQDYDLERALVDISGAVNKLERFDIFKSPISVFIDRPDQADPSTAPTDIDIYVHAHERSRYTIKTGTEAGSAEGSAYANVQLRNLFGGAESLSAHASAGTRTRSAYSATFDTPILSNPDLRWEIGGLASSTLKSWASHEEALKGGSTKLKWQTPSGHRHELAYSGLWRQITGLAAEASPTVRADAGNSFKSSIFHTYTLDRRDSPLLPSRGYLFKTVSELAGAGFLRGDVAFGKVEVESQAALPIVPPLGVSLTTSLRAGMLCPLAGPGGEIKPSRINDRFQLGGPTDIRGFRLAGLGPRDGPDATGGDVYAAGSASLMFPLPRTGIDSPLRLQAFVNAGRLLALKDPRERRESRKQSDVTDSMKDTIQDLAHGLPSCAAGVGLVYAHPVARFEVNFSLPLVFRKGEQGRKGLHFGVGIEFM
ncbi:outer membrane protein [Phyllosticta citribraziliensis]|uniref:Outer membrane protein n=1 Tax=Phyllosticta citribraziliensis TaxID=989973 RepID=A0ABR1L7I5_9PEZI